MLDTRFFGRDKQLEINSYINDKTLDKERYRQDLLKPRDLLGKEQLGWVSKKINKRRRATYYCKIKKLLRF